MILIQREIESFNKKIISDFVSSSPSFWHLTCQGEELDDSELIYGIGVPTGW